MVEGNSPLLVALRGGRRQMTFDDLMEAKFTEEIGTKQAVVYTDDERDAIAVHEGGHATVAYFLGKGRRLEVRAGAEEVLARRRLGQVEDVPGRRRFHRLHRGVLAGQGRGHCTCGATSATASSP